MKSVSLTLGGADSELKALIGSDVSVDSVGDSVDSDVSLILYVSDPSSDTTVSVSRTVSDTADVSTGGVLDGRLLEDAASDDQRLDVDVTSGADVTSGDDVTEVAVGETVEAD